MLKIQNTDNEINFMMTATITASITRVFTIKFSLYQLVTTGGSYLWSRGELFWPIPQGNASQEKSKNQNAYSIHPKKAPTQEKKLDFSVDSMR